MKIPSVLAAYIPWIKDTAERAVKTFIQVFVLQLIAAGWFTVDGIVDLSIVQRALLAAGGAGLSILSSALSAKLGDSGTASAVTVEAPAHGGTGDNV